VKKKNKPSKLREKSTRIPSIQMERKAQVIREYLARVSQRPELSEYARGVAFVQLLKDLLLEADPLFLQDYLQGMEHTLQGPKTALYNRGRVDALYGNLVIEFKRSLAKSLDEAREQLRKYLAALQQSPEDRRRPLIAIATDGIHFVAYAPRFSLDATTLAPQDIELVATETADVGAMSPEEVYYWLDRYFVRQTGPIAPRTKQIVNDFGPTSGSFVHALNVLDGLWKSVESDSESQVFFDSWQKYLRITYGGPVADRELFLRHTYLATLAKIMVWVRLTGATEPPAEKELRNVLNGSYFSQRGIHNFLEEDFFAWVARDAAWTQALIMSRRLLLQLATYNLRELSEDVLKGLYEKLVDPKDRHDLGEYYTPDWLAAKIVEKCLQKKPDASVLDPACGSGTFLYQTIRFKRQELGDSAKTLKHIEENVVGIDIHPLAVIVAKTTYLLGLGDLVTEREKAIRIPVYLADSVKPPRERVERRRIAKQGDLGFPTVYYAVPLDGNDADLPEELALAGQLYDRAVDLATQYAHSTAHDALPSEDGFRNFLRRNQAELAHNAVWVSTLYELFKVLRKKIGEKKNTIWGFVLKNAFKPLLLRGHFDVVVGNPPWLTYKDVERGEYQDFIKAEITSHYELVVGQPKLLTHMELATLFFVRCSDLYLHDKGFIGFLLPHSVFRGDQHARFRQQQFTLPVGFREVWDLEGVRPLFNVAACVVFGEKGAKASRSLPGETIRGNLTEKNAAADEAEAAIKAEKAEFRVYRVGTRSVLARADEGIRETTASPYAKLFRQGATIFPRSVWFVHPAVGADLGLDTSAPFVETDPRAEERAQEEYRGVRLEGQVEAEFLYATLLSTDLVAFGHLPFRTVVLPILPQGETYRLLTAAQAKHQGYLGLASWLEGAEAIWQERRGEKAQKMSIYERLDRYKGITQQRVRARFRVLYPDMTRVLVGAVTTEDDLISRSASLCLQPRGLIVESMLYCYETEDEGEASYLEALLNSVGVDSLLKTFRRRQQFNVPHIHSKIWEFPIPLYEKSNDDHVRLSALAVESRSKVRTFLTSVSGEIRQGSLGRLRRLIREKLQPQIAEIDSIVSKIL